MSKNVIWSGGYVSTEEFENKAGHRSGVLWFTGLSGSGKSTLARAVQRKLFDNGWQVIVLDGDNIRHGLNKDLGFTEEDRIENIRRISEVAALFQQHGHLVITAFISPYYENRKQARGIIGADRFHEIYIEADLETCKERDPKGLYEKVEKGEITRFTGVSDPFEAPKNPALKIDTSNLSEQQAIEALISYIDSNFKI